MGKISKQVSKGLGAAIQEVKDKIAGDQVEEQIVSLDVNDLLNAGVTAHNKRKKGKETQEDVVIPKGPTSLTHEEVCEQEIKKAHERGWPDPDFDFRNFYEKGHKAWYVHISEVLGEKEVVAVTLRTIYARSMIASEEKGLCHCIGYKEKDYVFENPRDANDFCSKLVLNAKYKPESKKASKEDYEEDDGDCKQEMPDLTED